MVSTDIYWDLHFSRSNPRQPAAHESIQKPTGAALSPHRREGSRLSLPRHLNSTQNRVVSGFKQALGLCPNTRRQRCPSHPAHGGSGATAKPSPRHGARRRARSRRGSPSRGSGTPGGQRAARRAGRRGAGTRSGTGRHEKAALYSCGSRSARAPRERRAQRRAARKGPIHRP